MRRTALPLLDFQNITVVRDKRPVLIDFSMSLAVGESVAILGPNGSGKSTFIKLITRELYPVQSPTAVFRIFGQAFWDVAELRTQLGIVSNDVRPYYEREVTAIDAVLSGYFSSIGLWPHHRPTTLMRKKSTDILRRLGIEHLLHRTMSHMSSGEAQRCLIGRALVHDPLAIVLDEPTNSLDIRSAQELRRTLTRIAKAGTGVILVTHHVEDILPRMTRVVMLREGRVFLDGPKKTLLTSQNLTRLFTHPVTIARHRDLYRLSADSL